MISVIVPVYNKSPFLKRCLDSLANQYDKSAQIIIVDDGSTDGSDKICDKYMHRYGWEVYHTKNNGVSAARNLGIQKAKGEYITFLDADDLFMPDAISVMNRELESSYGIYQFGQFRCKDLKSLDYFPYKTTEGHYHLDFIPKYWVLVWNKLYKRSLIVDNNIKFQEGMQFGEDALFNAECILANNGLYHAPEVIVIHCLDDSNSLCRGGLDTKKLKKLDDELCKLASKQTEPEKVSWMDEAISEHRNSRLFRRYGEHSKERPKGKYDVVYFVKDGPTNDELTYSLRSLEKNWHYKNVWFCGGCPANLKPDKHFKVNQNGASKWDRVRNMITEICKNDEITENFWLFNDDFFILKPATENMPPQYNSDLISYIERIEKKQGASDDYTERLRVTANTLNGLGKTIFNYEVHKPMLVNRKKALEVLDKFPDTPGFRSLYGNYWEIGGENKHDMKLKVLQYSKMSDVENTWDFLSTSDTSFHDGVAGDFIRKRFYQKSGFEK
ncbi:glycosyltransferase family 2 protein [Candidatus Saccharibacteria bacterium]|nr:glycosyltransferase family 2 protein [Candidatus Saccharibacteria bacterium]